MSDYYTFTVGDVAFMVGDAADGYRVGDAAGGRMDGEAAVGKTG